MHDQPVVPAPAAVSEFSCPGCGRPLAVTLHGNVCFAEAQIFCPDCERDFQERRGRWATPQTAIDCEPSTYAGARLPHTTG